MSGILCRELQELSIFDIQNHKKSTGKYNVHVYNWNTTSNLCQAEFRVSGNTTSTLKVSSVDNRSDLYRVQLKFADMPDDVDVVQFRYGTRRSK